MSRLFSTDKLKKLTEGCYESVIASVENAVNESSHFSGDVSVVGTFPSYAVVATTEGECARVWYKRTKKGVVVERIEDGLADSYGQDNLDDFINEERERALSLFAEDRAAATARLVKLAELKASKKVSPLLELEERLLTKRPWETFVEDNESHFGKVETFKVDSFDSAVERAEELKQFVEYALEAIAEDEELSESEAVKTLVTFSSDLLEDIRRIDTISKESPIHITLEEQSSRFHDLLADKLSRAGVAVNFISTMANCLTAQEE